MQFFQSLLVFRGFKTKRQGRGGQEWRGFTLLGIRELDPYKSGNRDQDQGIGPLKFRDQGFEDPKNQGSGIHEPQHTRQPPSIKEVKNLQQIKYFSNSPFLKSSSTLKASIYFSSCHFSLFETFLQFSHSFPILPMYFAYFHLNHLCSSENPFP